MLQSQIRSMKTGGYDVTFISYCGMSYPLGEGVERDEAIRLIRARLRSAKRRGKPVTKIAPGRWEIESRDDAGSISDNEGFLTVKAARRRYRVIFGRRVWLDAA